MRLPSIWSEEEGNFDFLPRYEEEEKGKILRAVELAISGVTSMSWPREFLTIVQILATYGYDRDTTGEILQHFGYLPYKHHIPPYVWAHVLRNPAVSKSRLQLQKEALSNTHLDPAKRVQVLDRLLKGTVEEIEALRQIDQKDLDEDPEDEGDKPPRSSYGTAKELAELTSIVQGHQNMALRLITALGNEQERLTQWHDLDSKGPALKLSEVPVLSGEVGPDSNQVISSPRVVKPLETQESVVATKEIADKSLILEALNAARERIRKAKEMADGPIHDAATFTDMDKKANS